MMLKRIGAVAFVLSLGSAALAQDDIEFARGLVRRGFFDLAEDILKRCESDPASSFVRAEIEGAKAESPENDLNASKTHLDKAIELLEKFRSANALHPLAFDALTFIGQIRARKAQLITDAMRAEQSPEEKAKLLKEAKKLYSELEDYYRQNIKKLQDQAKKNDDEEYALMYARLDLAKAQLDHALLPDTLDDEKKKLLGEQEGGVIKMMLDFEFDYNISTAFEAMNIEGRCYSELGNYDEAKKKFLRAVSLRQTLADKHVTPKGYHWEIIKNGYYYLAHSYNRQGKFKEALETIKKTFDNPEMKNLPHEPIGMAMMIEQAKALFEMGDMPTASALLQRVDKADPKGPWGAKARETMNSFTGGGANTKIKVTSEQMMTSAVSLWEKENYRDTVQALRRCIEAAITEADRLKYVPEAYYMMGQCFVKMRRFYEAAFAFEQVYRLYPKYESAAESCYEAVRCYASEYQSSGDPRDDAKKNEIMGYFTANYPNAPERDNSLMIQAEALEKDEKWMDAAKVYDQIPEKAEAFEEALVRCAFCYFADANAKFKKKKDDPDVKTELASSEERIKRFLARPEPPKPTEAQKKKRAGFLLYGNKHLAKIYMHEAIGRYDDCLALLDKNDKALPPDAEQHSSVWLLKIQCYLALKPRKLDDAVDILEQMFAKFPDGSPIAQASKSVAIALDEVTADLIKANKPEDQDKITENLKRISKYYSKWLDLAPSYRLQFRVADVVSVAQTLYMIARKLNGLDDNVISFLDLKGKAITERQYWQHAARVYGLLLPRLDAKSGSQERIEVATRLARCYSFLASSLEEWEEAKNTYFEIIDSYKLLTKNNQIDGAVLNREKKLLTLYLELGYVYFEIGSRGQKFQFDNARTVFTNVMSVTAQGSEPWWIAKYMSVMLLYKRGDMSDIADAKLLLNNVEKSNPDFDGGKFGMKQKFAELKEALKALGPK